MIYIAGTRSRASSFSQQDTDYVILQSSPVLHWVPVSEEALAADSSSSDSLDSVTITPIAMQRASSQRSLSSLRSSCSVTNHQRSTLLQRPLHQQRPSSLLISPPASPRPASRSKSTDYGVVMRRDSDDLSSISIPVPAPSGGLPARLGRLRDKLLGTGPTPVPERPLSTSDESGAESTPLVSELSSPSHSSDPTESPAAVRGSGEVLTLDDRCVVPPSGIVVREMSHSSIGARSLSRQNAYEWENPETPV